MVNMRYNKMNGLVDDLVVIVATYTTEPVTYYLLTLSSNLTRHAYANKQYFWWTKALYETRGLTVNPDIIDNNWANYYRLNNRSYYGTCKVLEVPAVHNIHTTSISIPVVTCMSYHNTQFETRVLVQDASGDLSIYKLPAPNDQRMLKLVAQLSPGIPRIRVIQSPDGPNYGNYIYWVDERGDCYSLDKNTNAVKALKLGYNLVTLLVATDYYDLIYLSRDGTATSTRQVLSDSLLVTNSSYSAVNVLSMDGKRRRLHYMTDSNNIIASPVHAHPGTSIGYVGLISVNNQLRDAGIPYVNGSIKLLYVVIMGLDYPYVISNRHIRVSGSEQPELGLVQHVQYNDYFLFIVD